MSYCIARAIQVTTHWQVTLVSAYRRLRQSGLRISVVCLPGVDLFLWSARWRRRSYPNARVRVTRATSTTTRRSGYMCPPRRNVPRSSPTSSCSVRPTEPSAVRERCRRRRAPPWDALQAALVSLRRDLVRAGRRPSAVTRTRPPSRRHPIPEPASSESGKPARSHPTHPRSFCYFLCNYWVLY